ncbi:hypothetical protein ACWENO_34945 [Streptomyces sp. NPDC004436]
MATQLVGRPARRHLLRVLAEISGGGHREAILDCNHKDVGIGYATGADNDALWTLLLAHH